MPNLYVLKISKILSIQHVGSREIKTEPIDSLSHEKHLGQLWIHDSVDSNFTDVSTLDRQNEVIYISLHMLLLVAIKRLCLSRIMYMHVTMKLVDRKMVTRS